MPEEIYTRLYKDILLTFRMGKKGLEIVIQSKL